MTHRLRAVHRCDLLLQMSHLAWSVCVSVCQCVLGTGVSYAKASEPIEMPFERLIQVDIRNHVLDEAVKIGRIDSLPRFTDDDAAFCQITMFDRCRLL